MRRAAAAGMAAALIAAGCGGSEAPPRPVRTVALPPPPLADALGKQAEVARLAGGDLGALLDRLQGAGDFELRRPAITRDGITVRDVRVRKRGDRAAGEGTVDPRELARLAPGGLDLRYDPGAGGPGIVLRGSRTVLGVDVPVTVRLVPRDGAVVAEPEGIPLSPVTLFADPRFHVEGLAARPLPGGLVRGRVVGQIR